MKVAILLRNSNSNDQNTFEAQFTKWFKELSMSFNIYIIDKIDVNALEFQEELAGYHAVFVDAHTENSKLTSLVENKNLKNITLISQEKLSSEQIRLFNTNFPRADIIHGRGLKSIRWAARKSYYTSRNKLLKIKYGLHFDQIGDLAGNMNKNKKLPVVVLIHGGFWRFPYERDMNYRMLDYLVRNDVLVWNIEYRRVTNTDDYHHTQTEEDVIDAVSYIKEMATFFPMDLSKILVVGHSAGGYLALRCGHELAKRGEQIAGIVSMAGVVNLKMAHQLNLGNGVVSEYLGDRVTESYFEKLHTQLKQNKIPLWLIHGVNDETVPIKLSEAFYNEMKAQDAVIKYSKIPEADHMDLTKPHFSFWEDLVAIAKNPDLLKLHQDEKIDV